MTGTFAPSSVLAGSTTSLTGTTITQPLDLTKLGAGLRSAATLAVVGTQDPLDLTGPLLGQNEVSSTVSLAE